MHRSGPSTTQCRVHCDALDVLYISLREEKQVKRLRNCFLGMSGRKLAGAWLQVLLGSSPNRRVGS